MVWSPGRPSKAPSASLRDSLRSPLTADPETKNWLVIGEAETSGRVAKVYRAENKCWPYEPVTLR
jgi:hypothetical protein